MSGMTTASPQLDATSLPASIRHARADVHSLLILAARIHTALPNIASIVNGHIRQKIRQRTGADLDPDTLWLHTFSHTQSSSETFNGWQHDGPPTSSQTVTDAVRHNFDASWQDATPDDVNQQAGIYTEGPAAPHFGVENEVRYLASDLRDDILAIDVQAQIDHAQNRFWANHREQWRTLVKADFVLQARKALAENNLSEQGYRLVMECGAPNVPSAGLATFEMLQATAAPSTAAQIFTFDINGYPSSDIRRFVGTDGFRVMYLPGERLPFLEFADESALQRWVVEQAKNAPARQALCSHFSLYNRQDGTWCTGVDHSLERLARGEWRLSDNVINSHSQRVSSDVFEELATATQLRSHSDTDTLIQSDAEVRLEMLRRYLAVFNTVFSPMLGVLDPVMGMLGTLAFGAELGIEALQAATDDSQAKRHAALAELMENGVFCLPMLFGAVAYGSAISSGTRNLKDWYWPEHTGHTPAAGRTPLDNAVYLSASEQYLEALFEKRNNIRGLRVGVANLSELKSFDFAIPDTAYRAHTNLEGPDTGLNRAAGSTAAGDDYLAAIVKHTARSGGSAGEVMSLTKDVGKALNFSLQYLADGRSAPIYVIDTTGDPQAFRTAAHILLNDAPRLIQSKKITAATFFEAVEKLSLQENEIFYIKGNIPGAYVRLLD